jgi:hypothetical protein
VITIDAVQGEVIRSHPRWPGCIEAARFVSALETWQSLSKENRQRDQKTTGEKR